MSSWLTMLKGDPLPWLLEEDTPAVRHLALRQLLDQLGADGSDARVQAACDYVLTHSQARTGGFAYWGGGRREEVPPPPSLSIHCLNGNLLRALIGFGWLEEERVQRAIDWQARSITGEGFSRYYLSGTSGPGFRCAANEQLPCAWGAIKGLLALARIPPQRRAPHVERAIQQGGAFLFSSDPAIATYPAGWGNVKPGPSWFKLGFPIGYVADILQNVAVLCELGFAKDARLEGAVEWLLSQQEQSGRWRNQSASNGKTWVNIDKQGQLSKWVTLRACSVLKAVYG